MKARTIFISLVILQVCSLHANFLPEWLSAFDRKGSRKRDLEGKFAQSVYNSVSLAHALTDQRPTNWTQASGAVRPEVWARYEQEFLLLPEATRWFKNSVWEKYVFVEQGVQVPDQSWTSGGDLVMVQVGAPAGAPKRFVIWRNLSGKYEIGPFSQTLIQEWFAKAGKQMPRPAADLAPATPPGWHLEPAPRDYSGIFSFLLLLFCGVLLVVFIVVVFRRFRQFKVD